MQEESFSEDNIYQIKGNEVLIEYSDINSARIQAKNEAFFSAYSKLLDKIVPRSEQTKRLELQIVNVSELVSDFTVKEEDFFQNNYSATIDVNFYPTKINNLLKEFDISLSNVISEEFLILPVYFNHNTYFLWEKNNKWYQSLKDNYEENSLLKLFFPDLNIINKFNISASEAISLDLDSYEKILKVYNKKSIILIYLQENYDYKIENFISKVSFKIFTQKKFEDFNLNNKLLEKDFSKKSQIDLFAKLSLKELNDWWKNKTNTSNDSEDIKSFFVLSEFLNLKESLYFENLLRKNPLIISLLPNQISKNSITYNLTSYGSMDKITLALRAFNFDLEYLEELKIYKLKRLD